MSEELERYKCDRDRRDYERLVESHRPLVASVCRRYLRDPYDVEDVVQETFLKLAGHLESVNGSLGAWLTATAHTTSVDLIRKSVRERNRRLALARVAPTRAQHVATREAIRGNLQSALELIEPSARELLIERFARKTPLGVIAVRLKLSVPTASRRVAQAIRQLGSTLREMGVEPADDRSVAGHLGDIDALESVDDSDHGELRFAPDWRSADLSPLGFAGASTPWPGWSRPMRVGVLVSYQSTSIVGINRVNVGTKWQVHSASFFPQKGLQLVGVVEPGTVHRGIVEGTLRDYGILGGLIEADDAAGLQTLDVLLIGINYHMTSSITAAINRAVRGGLGLLNEYWTGSHIGLGDDENMQGLMLADSPAFKYHMPGECGDPLPATVLREHHLLPGLRQDARLQLRGCGPAYKVIPGAQVLVMKDRFVQAQEHGMSGVGAIQMPCYILGELGRGRVAVIHSWPHEWFVRALNIPHDEYFVNLLKWLAGSRAENG